MPAGLVLSSTWPQKKRTSALRLLQACLCYLHIPAASQLVPQLSVGLWEGVVIISVGVANTLGDAGRSLDCFMVTGTCCGCAALGCVASF